MISSKRICVINETRKTVVATNVVRAETFLQRLFGLMLRPALRPGEGLLLEPCNGIHTCFMRFPIDAVFLNENWQVVSIYRALKPWRFVPFVAGAELVLELPAGQTLASSVEQGDFLTPVPHGADHLQEPSVRLPIYSATILTAQYFPHMLQVS